MCGIAGYLHEGFTRAEALHVRRMAEVMAHRGPDAGGEFQDERISLAHRRLSIIDLSPQGNQPMFSCDERYVIVFNGEIYNFLPLRAELEKGGYGFRSRTDTEVILALYAQQGSACLKRLHGMFAFAVWDRLEHTLFLARDRIGKKPLYYFHDQSGRFAFASEIKALLELPGIPRDVEPTAIADFLKYLYIPAPKTIFRNIRKLPPAHFMFITPDGRSKIEEYWDIDFGTRSPGTLEETAGELLDLIERNTADRMVADVPLGAFLSGGVDSSAVVAMMSRSSGRQVRTCTIGFNDREHDETGYAREVARLFGTDHVEYVVGDNLAGTVMLLPRYFDEPFADSSAVPTYHVSRLARKAVTVALAGDGGDENFGGYEKYATELQENCVRRSVPRPMLRLIGGMTRGGGSVLMRKAATLAHSALSDPGRAFYGSNSFIGDNAMDRLMSAWLRAECRGYDPAEHTLKYWHRTEGADHVTSMLYTDLKTYLPGDILVKVDRMSMANSLEVRAPLLDHRIVEFAASFPSRWKIGIGGKKKILKRAFGRILPRQVLERRKPGFTVPLDRWFRSDLRNLTEERLINDPAMERWFSMPELRRIWQEHCWMKQNHGTLLWTLLSFALWHREYVRG